MQVLTRSGLARPGSGEDASCLLLEGSWTSLAGTRAACEAGDPIRHGWSLDETIDARFAWIDEVAERLAALAGATVSVCSESGWSSGFSRLKPGLQPRSHGHREQALGDPADATTVSPLWINALALRYYLVKLLRVVAWFTEVRAIERGDAIDLTAVRERDEDYGDVLRQLARQAGAELSVRWIESALPRCENPPPNPRWRRWLGALGATSGSRGSLAPRVVLCGNPRLLDPVCRELVSRDVQVWWLYDRFALRSWVRWRASGVRQLVCNSSLGEENRLVPPQLGRLECRGVDLSRSVSRWIAERMRICGPAQTRLVEQIDGHFRRLRPDRLVVDEDATPMTRVAVAIGRRYGVESFAVEHGAPLARFGFAPPAADRLLVWGQPARRQLERWGVAAERISVAGSPWHDLVYRELCRLKGERPAACPHPQPLSRKRARGALAAGAQPRLVVGNRPPRILLLTTVPPRDDRPDVVALHLTRATYAQMLRIAVAAVAKLDGAELIVKLHPRTADDPAMTAALGQFPQLKAQLVHGGRLEEWIAKADCVLSCTSSAGVDATLAGVPVIQLAPAGSAEVLPSDEWGMLGTARSGEELERLLDRALREEYRPADLAQVFEQLDGRAAARVADAILGGLGLGGRQIDGHQAAAPFLAADGTRRVPATKGAPCGTSLPT